MVVGVEGVDAGVGVGDVVFRWKLLSWLGSVKGDREDLSGGYKMVGLDRRNCHYESDISPGEMAVLFRIQGHLKSPRCDIDSICQYLLAGLKAWNCHFHRHLPSILTYLDGG